jgi:HJR/Mrr/RecB family endonuclease
VIEAAARTEWDSVYTRFKGLELRALSGEEFEAFLRSLFVAMGFSTMLTPKTGDQGADLIVWKSAGRIAIQAKRQDQPVGNRAIQELLGGMLSHKCKKGIVATTSTFTRSARALAGRDSRISLWDYDRLCELYREHLADPPPFSWEEYRRLKETLGEPASVGAARKRRWKRRR